MRKFYLVLLTVLFAAISNAQVSVTATAGTPGPTPYTTLKLAFDAINAGTHQGAITIDISASTTEGTTPATLNSSGAGPALYTSVLIRPTADGVSVSGNPVTGFGVIQLKGADNVTIDGDNPGTAGTNRNLTVNNTTTTTVIANSCIRIATAATVVTSADNITIKNCILNGNVTSGNASGITSTTGSSNSSFGIYCGGNGGTTATDAPTAITSVTANSAPSGTTINALVIDNNIVNQCARAITFIGAASTVSTGVTITNNLVGDQTALSGAPPYITPVTTVYTKGIFVSGANAVTITGNSVKNILSFVGTQMNGIELNTAMGTGSMNISNNTVTGVVNNGTVSGVRGIDLASAAAGATLTVNNNTVSNVQTLAGATIMGIQLSTSATSGIAEKNMVSNVYSRGTGGFGSYGINVAAGNAITIQNNFIWDINAHLNNSGISSSFGPHGIRLAAGINHKVYHNSVHLSGALVGATSVSLASAFTLVSTASTGVDVRNNIFSNVMTGSFSASSPVVAIWLPSGGTSAMTLTLNNNAYYEGTGVGAATAQVGTTSGTGVFLAANFNSSSTSPANNLRSYTSLLSAAGTNDNLSLAFSSAAPFTSATNLHINTGVTPTRLESGGATVGVTTDIDGNVRPGPAGSVNGGANAPDMGADEFDGVPLDLFPPIITYTPLSFICSGGARTLTATITDVSGVPTAGLGLPVLYWRINAGAYTAATGVSLGGGQYQFTFGAGAVLNDVISYYIVAQDNAGTPNVGVSPSTGAAGFSANPPAVSTPPTAPSTYAINNTLSGTFNVGTGQTYITLTAAVAAYNTSCLTGPVVFLLTDATYPGETFPITVNANPFASSTNTLTIKPATGVTPLITGSNAAAIIKLNAADYVTIDGSNSGGTTRNLTVTNSNTGTSSIVIWLASTAAGDGVTNNTVKNCIISATAASLACIVTSGSAAGGVAEAQNNNNTIRNNALSTSFYGIAMVGPNGNETGNLITENAVGSTVALNKIGNNGIAVFQQQNAVVSDNTVTGVVTSGTNTTSGISVNGTANGIQIFGNKISDIKNTSTSGFGTNGIQLSSNTTTANVTVYNNFISDVAAFGFNGTGQADNGYGIIASAGGGYNIYYNTVNMNTSQTAAGGLPGAMNITSGVTTAGSINIRNNIFANNQTVGTNRYSIVSSAANTVFASIDYNDYFTTGPNLGIIASVNRVDIPAIQAGFGGNLNSISVAPVFVSATDLHLATTSGVNWCLNGSGIVIPGITTDIDGTTRSTGVKPLGPDLGADEFVPTGFVVNNPAPVCSPGTVDLTAAAVTTGSMGGLTFTYFSDAAATVPVGTPAAVAASGTYYIKATSGTCSVVLPVVVVVTTPPSATISYAGTPYCANAGTATVTHTGTTGGAYSSTAGLVINPTTGAVTLATSTPGSYTVTYTVAAAGGCPVYTTTTPITITAVPAATISYPGTPYCTYGVSAPVLHSGTTGGTYSAAPAGLTINPATGEVNPSTSTPGSYTVTYTIAASGGCALFTATAPIDINVCVVDCIEDFDDVTAPALPGGWLASSAIVNGASQAWATVTSPNSSAPNSAFTNEPNSPSDERLDSRIYAISSNPTQLVFRNSFNLEIDFDGMVLEISINAGAFTDIITAGGSFVTGGYNRTISAITGSPIPGRNAWSGNSGGYINTIVTLPAAALGQPVVFRWRRATDNSVAGTGVSIDDVYVIETATINYAGSPYCPGGTATVTRTGTPGGAYSSTPGLVINSLSGDVNLATSTPGTYTVTYTISGPPACPVFTTTATIVINPTPNAIATPSSQTICSGATITTIVLTSGVAGTTYAWTRDNTVAVTGIASSGSGDISGALTNTTNAPVTVTFTITPTAAGCVGPTTTATVLVNPTPNAVATPSSQTKCSGVALTPIVLTSAVTGTTYAWTRDNTVAVTGIAASGTGNITGTLTNTTTAPVTVTFTITPTANGCPGPTTTATVLVNPTPNAVATPASQTICSATAITTIVPSGGVSGTTFNWTRNNTVNVTGIAASGSGNISGTLTNTTNTPQTVTFTITPTANGCPGPTTTATVLVNPTPTVTPQGGIEVIVTGNGWFADEISWTLTNAGGTVVLSGGPYPFDPPPTSSGTVTSAGGPFTFFIEAEEPSGFEDNTLLWEVRCNGVVVASGCIEGPQAFAGCPNVGNLTVPGINGCGSNLGPQTVCSGVPITTVALVGPVAGTVFNWTRDNNANVTGIAASGSGNISGTLTNSTNVPQTVIFTITPTANGCPGPPVTVTFTVNPTLNAVATPSSQTICSGAAITPIVLTGNVSGTVFNWTRNNTANVTGIAASGSGNISGTLTNTTTSAQTVTFTITPSYTNGGVTCTGTPITATVTVQAGLVLVCPNNITVNAATGTCAATVTFAATVTGTPAPTVTYVPASGSSFPVGTTTVTVTATNSCATVSCTFTVTVLDVQIPAIGGHPQSQSKCVGDNVTFNVTSTFVASYQWQSFNGTIWVNIPGATASSYTINNLTLANTLSSYRVQVTGPCGTVTSSNPALLTVYQVPSVVLGASIPPFLLPTQTLTLTATAVPTGGTYVWRKNGNVIVGATGSTLSNLTVNDVGSYTVTYTLNGCTSTSNAIVVTAQASENMYVYPNPNFGQFQVRFYNQVNEAVIVTVYDSKGSLVYQRSVTTTTPYTSIDINLGNRQQGSYLVELRNSAGKVVGSKWVVVYH